MGFNREVEKVFSKRYRQKKKRRQFQARRSASADLLVEDEERLYTRVCSPLDIIKSLSGNECKLNFFLHLILVIIISEDHTQTIFISILGQTSAMEYHCKNKIVFFFQLALLTAF